MKCMRVISAKTGVTSDRALMEQVNRSNIGPLTDGSGNKNNIGPLMHR